ncbi:MAG: AAA family ATPase, partial [Bacteroidetes bacterium]|nr:AAA family ATPase [Bacteroidota bacterium]
MDRKKHRDRIKRIRERYFNRLLENDGMDDIEENILRDILRKEAEKSDMYDYDNRTPFDTGEYRLDAAFSDRQQLDKKETQYGRRDKPPINYISLPENFQPSEEFKQIFNKVENTNENLEITGKAGTGKSTLLHYIVQNTKKQIIVLAPTGIAAINIGGSTIHSFFRLPFGPLSFKDKDISFFSKTDRKRKLIEKLDTIIIDEISMVKADILDAIDYSLRINGGDKNKLFGGKQIIIIGDLFQLPPVVRNSEAERVLYEEVYATPFFFSARAFQQAAFNSFKLQKVYRQNDESFIALLDSIRIGNLGFDQLELLEKRYDPDFEPAKDEFIISLVTKNIVADGINTRKLREISEKEFKYSAEITGDFKQDRYPAPLHCSLKKGAQIIFVKNDYERRWVNGTLGKIHKLASDKIEV